MVRPPERSTSIPRLWSLALAATGLAALAGCRPAPPFKPFAGSLLMTVDSLRRDHVSAYGYRSPFGKHEATTPAFEALAAGGVLFENALSSTSWTLPSHASLFTGLPDPLHRVTENGARIAPALTTLAELHEQAGHATSGSFAGPNLHPAFGFAQGFEDWIDCSGVALDDELFENAAEAAPGSFVGTHRASHAAVTSPQTLAAAQGFLEQRAEDEQPFFLFAHWWDAHYDYTPPPEYVGRFVDPNYSGRFRGIRLIEKGLTAGPADVAFLKSMYDAEIRYTDDHISELLADLERLGLAGSTAVCLTSDHGEEFYEHERWGHQHTLYQEVLEIPLVIRAPGVAPAGVRVPGAVQLQDLYATLATLAGLEIPSYVESRDLTRLWEDPDQADRPAFAHLEVPLREIKTSTWTLGRRKAQFDHASGEGWFFDLTQDPTEQHPRSLAPLANSTDAADQTLLGLLRELARQEQARPGIPGANSTNRSEMSAELRQSLRDAGYLQD